MKGLSTSLLFKWPWSEGYYGHSNVCLLPWPSYLHRLRRKLVTKLYHKRHDFTFPIVNFTFINSNIPAAPGYGIYIRSIRYSMVCAKYSDFLHRAQLLT